MFFFLKQRNYNNFLFRNRAERKKDKYLYKLAPNRLLIEKGSKMTEHDTKHYVRTEKNNTKFDVYELRAKRLKKV